MYFPKRSILSITATQVKKVDASMAKEFERIGNEMFRNELEALDSNIYKRLKGVEGGVDGLPDRIKKWIADGRLRYAYMSDETGEIFVGRAAEEKRAEDLKNGIDEAKYLEHVKNLDPGVFSAIRKSESMVDNLLSFGEKDGTTSSERKKKIIEAYKNRCKADVCDGFFDGAEVLDCPIRFASIFRGETTKADVLIDFTEAGHSVQDKRHERRRVNEMKINPKYLFDFETFRKIWNV